MTICIFSHNREQMLDSIVANLPEANVIIVDDYSDFNVFKYPTYVYRSEEKMGKHGFWKQWKMAFDFCLWQSEELYVFMPDDFLDMDWNRIREAHERFKHEPYACNIINDGREECWQSFKPQIIDKEFKQIGFVDCGFFCNFETLRKLNFTMYETPIYTTQPNRSSGVGQQLTTRLNKAGVKIYLPTKSMAFHGAHESMMHKQERIKNPLISK